MERLDILYHFDINSIETHVICVKYVSVCVCVFRDFFISLVGHMLCSY